MSFLDPVFNSRTEDFSERLSTALPPYWEEFISDFNKTVYGQERAIRKIVQRLMILSSGMRSKKRPVSPLLFAGPPSSGKTFTAETVARLWIGNPTEEQADPLIHIAGEEYAEKHTVATLLGAPPGYIGHGGSKGHKRTPSPFEGIGAFDQERISNLVNNTIVEWLKDRDLYDSSPDHLKEIYSQIYKEETDNITNKSKRSVVLIDEFEKMHPDVQKVFLNILEKGVLRLHTGPVIDFKQSLIIFTSNLGTKRITKHVSGVPIGFQSETDTGVSESMNQEIYEIVLEEVKKHLDPAIYDRIGHDGIVVFQKLSKEHYSRILVKELSEVQAMVSGKDERYPVIRLSFSTLFKEFILNEADKAAEGARQMNRLIEKHVRHPLALYISNGELQTGDIALFTCEEREDGELVPAMRRLPRPDMIELEAELEMINNSIKDSDNTDTEEEITSRVKTRLGAYWSINNNRHDPHEDPDDSTGF